MLPLSPKGGPNPADTLTSKFSPPGLREKKSLLFQATEFLVIYYSSPREIIQRVSRDRTMKPLASHSTHNGEPLTEGMTKTDFRKTTIAEKETLWR